MAINATRDSLRHRNGFVLLAAVGAALGCLDDVEVRPRPPTLQPVASPVFVPHAELGGTKPAGTAVLNFDDVIVALNQEQTWTARVPLQLGANAIEIGAQSAAGMRSNQKRSPRASVTFIRPCPGAPSFAPPPVHTQATSHGISGTKPTQTSVQINGTEISAIAETTGSCVSGTCTTAPSVSCTTDEDCDNTWQHTIDLTGGDQSYDFEVVAIDANGKPSAPVRFSIELDTTPPQITATYPDRNAVPAPVDVPTNAYVTVTFGEPLAPGDDAGRLTVSDGAPVPGLVEYLIATNTLRWHAAAGNPLQPSTAYTVHVDDTLIDDTLGSVRVAGTTQDFSFTTLADSVTYPGGADANPPPTTPTVTAPSGPVATPTATLTGTKDPWSSIWIDDIDDTKDAMIVPVDGRGAWSYDVPLALNLDFTDTVTTVNLQVRSVADVAASFPAPVSITRTSNRPDPPTLDPATATSVTSDSVSLSGTKPAGTSVLLDGRPIVCSGDDTTWSYDAELIPGVNVLKLVSEDPAGESSDETVLRVNFVQDYQGTVPNGFTLKVFLELRDLSGVAGLRREWVAGPNQYAVEAWVEGPIEPGEVCEMVDHERKNIKYVATIQSYIGRGTKRVPYKDDDYAGTDFLAAMISGDVFGFDPFFLDATTDRRDAVGRFNGNLLANLTETDLRGHYDCQGLVNPLTVSACTSGTQNAGPLDPSMNRLPAGWTPRARPTGALLDQGDYLLNIQINLDRNGAWIFDNDFETCWEDPAYDNTGMHRVVRRISLGSKAYELHLPQGEEKSGPDRQGSQRLHYIDVDGVSIFWGPG